MNGLILKITGQVEQSNFDEFKTTALAMIKEADKPLVSDQDFADAEQTVKNCKIAEDAIKAAKDESMMEVADISSLFESLDEVSAALRKTRLSLNKKVTAEKNNRKQQVIDDGCQKMRDAISAVAQNIPEIHNAISVRVDLFQDAVSGKKKIDSMIAAVDNLLEFELRALDDAKRLIEENKKLIESCEFPELFPDRATLVCVPTAELQATIEGRVSKQKLAEKERQEREEREKAESKVAEEVNETEVGNEEAPQQKTNKFKAPPTAEEGKKHNYIITVLIYCTEEEAKNSARAIRLEHEDTILENGLKLEREE